MLEFKHVIDEFEAKKEQFYLAENQKEFEPVEEEW